MDPSTSNWSEPDQQVNEPTTTTERPPNRAARKLAQKKESKEKKMSTTTSKSVTSRVRSKKSNKPIQPRNPKTNDYEFGGILGAIAMVLFLPLVVLLFSSFNRENEYLLKQLDINSIWDQLKNWSYGSIIWYLAIVSQLAVFSTVTPGEEVEGTVLRDGSRLKYKINALATFQSFILISVMALRGQGSTLFSWTRTHFIDITIVSILFSLVISLVVYIKSFYGEPLLALGGNTGNIIYDFMIGRELNPRFRSFDLKFFTELRPGLIMWLCLNVTFAFCQWIELGRLTYSMVLVNIFQAWYVLDALVHESSILTTMDITTDGFGFMLVFGNLCWVPMIYSLQSRYLLDHPLDLNLFVLGLAVVFQSTGYYIFRSAASEKDTFRNNPKDPKIAYLKSMDTKSGKKLIISGWWGRARHINYLGDLLMAFAWCLPCGFDSIVPYFYFIYMAVLLVNRERRDEKQCRQKYGNDWEKYCSLVKYRIIPGIY
ncbi:unnamed protein product [Rhizopus stolonifer]